MGLQHSAYRAYGFEIPATTDFEHLEAVLADQPDGERLGHDLHPEPAWLVLHDHS